jgi:hypothetical protein
MSLLRNAIGVSSARCFRSFPCQVAIAILADDPDTVTRQWPMKATPASVEVPAKRQGWGKMCSYYGIRKRAHTPRQEALLFPCIGLGILHSSEKENTCREKTQEKVTRSFFSSLFLQKRASVSLFDISSLRDPNLSQEPPLFNEYMSNKFSVTVFTDAQATSDYQKIYLKLTSATATDISEVAIAGDRLFLATVFTDALNVIINLSSNGLPTYGNSLTSQHPVEFHESERFDKLLAEAENRAILKPLIKEVENVGSLAHTSPLIL